MAVRVQYNSVFYDIPTQGDLDWSSLTEYLVAISTAPGSSISLDVVGSTPNTFGASIVSNVFQLEPADGTHPGVLTAGSQVIGGAKKFLSGITFNDNTVQTTAAAFTALAAFGSSPNVDGASLSGSALVLQPASGSFPGGVSTTAQSLAGKKTFNDGIGLGSAGITFSDASTQVTAALSTTLGSFGSSPNTKGLSITGSALSLQPADTTNPGGVSTTTQSFAGNKTFTGNIAAANLSGTNSGDVTIGVVGGTPNSAGASLAGQVLSLQPADSSNPGVVTASTQTLGGAKTLANDLTLTTGVLASGVANGASAIGLKVNTPSYTTAGAKLLSLQNNSVEKFSVDKDGVGVFASSLTAHDLTLTSGSMTAATGWSLGLNPNPPVSSIVFSTYGSGFTVNDTGDQVWASGKATSQVANGASAKAFLLNTPSYTTAGAKLLSLQNNSVEKFSVDKDGNVSGTNVSGTNTGDVTLAAFGSADNANGASLSGQVLTLQPASNTHPGGVTTGTQTFAGAKEFSGAVQVDGSLTLGSTNTNNLISATTDAGGVTAFLLQTTNPLSTAKLFSLQNSSTEKFGVDHSGNGNFGGPTVTTQPGNAATGAVKLHGVINNQTGAAVGNGADTTEDVLFTYTVPANAFNQAGQGVRVTAWGSGVNTANSTTVKLYFGATVVLTKVLTVSQANTWTAYYQCFQTSTGNTQTASGEVSNGGTATSFVQNTVAPAETTSGTIVIKVTGQRGTTATANSVVCNGMLVEFVNN